MKHKIWFFSIVLLCFIVTNKADVFVCSSLEYNTEFKGNDFITFYALSNPEACASTCSFFGKVCTAFTFTYRTNFNVCILKNFTSTPLRTKRPGYISCIMVNVRTTIQTSTDKPISSTRSSTIKTSKPITSTMSTQPRCFTETDAFFVSSSESSDVMSASNLDECCFVCQSYVLECVAFSFLADQSMCFLYKYGSPLNKIYRDRSISGIVNTNYNGNLI